MPSYFNADCTIQILHKLNGTHPLSGDPNQVQQHSHLQRPRAGSSTIRSNKALNDDTSTTAGGEKSNPRNPKAGDDRTALQLTTNSAAGKINTQSLETIPMPLERREVFASPSQVVVPNLADAGEKGFFERNFLKSTIGGAVQSLIVRSVSTSLVSSLMS